MPRAAVAVRVRGGEDATTLRASAGKGIKEPDFSQSYGVSFFAQGNPDLEARAEPQLRRRRRAATGRRPRCASRRRYFDHDYDDQIAYTVVDFNTFQGTLREPGRDPGPRRRAGGRGRARSVRFAFSAPVHVSRRRGS